MDHNVVWLILIVQTLLFAAGAPLITGIIKWAKCQLQNRVAPPIWQPYLNLHKLFHKEVMIPNTSSIIFRITPYLIFGITLIISAAIPLFVISTAANNFADVIAIIGLLALSRFWLALAGMDTGTAFGGMGSSREMLIAAITEPAITIIFFGIAMTAASTNLSVIINHLDSFGLYLNPSIILAAIGFTSVALAENGRIPIDNPATHLELTMIHEAMILEYSGKYLALLEWSAQIKLMIYATLLINIFFPWGISHEFNWIDLGWGLFIYSCKIVTLTAVLGFGECYLAKLRLFRAPYLLNLGFICGLLGVLIHIIIEVG